MKKRSQRLLALLLILPLLFGSSLIPASFAQSPNAPPKLYYDSGNFEPVYEIINEWESRPVPQAFSYSDTLTDVLCAGWAARASSINVSAFNLPYDVFKAYYLANIHNCQSVSFDVRTSWSYSPSGGIVYSVSPQYLSTSMAERNAMKAEIDAAADRMLATVPPGASELEKVLAVNDFLALNVAYDPITLSGNSGPDAVYTAYGALGNGVAVCQGYALAANYLFELLDIESRYASSDAMNHGWNMVQVDGNWYHLDITWNDPTPDQLGRVAHSNFLRSGTGIGATGHHDWDSGLPAATSTAYDSFFWTGSGYSSAMINHNGSWLHTYASDNKQLHAAAIPGGTLSGAAALNWAGIWPVSDMPGYYWTKAPYIGKYGDKVFYNTPTSLRYVDLASMTDYAFAYTPSPALVAGQQAIYEMRIEGDYARIRISTFSNSPQVYSIIRDEKIPLAPGTTSVTGLGAPAQKDYTVAAGTTQQISGVAVTPGNATNQTVLWNSTDTGIASVSSTGLVTGVMPGVTYVVASTANGAYAQRFQVTVTAGTAPTITSAANTTAVSGTAKTFQMTADGSMPITYSLTGAPAGVSINGTSGLISIGASAAAGVHTFTITATNGISPNATQAFTLTVNAAPAITGPAALTLAAGYAATSTDAFTASGYPAPTVTKTSGDAKITWNNTTKKLDIAAGLAAGTYPVSLKAANGIGTDAIASFTLTVTAAPAITGPTALTLTTGYAAASTDTFTVSGYPAPTVTKTSGDAKITWNNTTKKLDIAAGLAAGTYPVSLKASNGIGTDATASFTLTVNTVAIAASSAGLGSLQVGKAVSGASVTYTLSGASYAASITPANFAVTGLPAGLTAGTAVRSGNNTVTVAITGTPTAYSASGITLTIPASVAQSNAAGASAAIPVSGTVTTGAIAKGTPAAFQAHAAKTASYTSTLTLADIPLDADYAWTSPATALTAIGTASYPATYTPNENYNPIGGNITVTVNKASGVFGTPAAIHTAYTPGMTLASLNAQLPAGYAWVTPAAALNAGDGQSFAAAYTDPDGKYLPANGSITVNVSKAPAPAANAVTREVVIGAPQTINYNLTELLPGVNPGSWGTLSYAVASAANGDGVLTSVPGTGPASFPFTLNIAETGVSGKTATITFTVTSTNYADFNVSLIIKTINKTPVTVSGVTMAGKTYDGTPCAFTGTPVILNGSVPVTGITLDRLYVSTDGGGYSSAAAPVNAGKYKLTLSVPTGNAAYIGKFEKDFTILKKEITIKADDKSAKEGSVQPACSYTLTPALAAGDTLRIPPAVACPTANMNVPGTYPIVPSGADAGPNYSISYQNGTLTVTKAAAAIQFSQPSYTVQYRGTLQLSASGTGLTYTSSNPAKVHVDQNGKVTSLGAGAFSFSKTSSATITATDGTATGTTTVNVTMAWWQWLIVIFLFGWIWY